MAREVIEIFLRWERQEIRTEFWLGNRLEDREDDGRITLRWILGRWVVRMEGERDLSLGSGLYPVVDYGTVSWLGSKTVVSYEPRISLHLCTKTVTSINCQFSWHG
jgi:hypothetical protein